MLTNEQLSAFQTQLLKAKRELEERLRQNDHFGKERSHAHDSVGELASYDNHPADEATELYEREKDIALNEHAERELKEIEHALEAIKNGTYGTCQICGNPIPHERLEALPTTTYCKEHSPDQVVSQKRPLEEEVLMPPFGKFDFDDRAEAETYDAEDAWQEVARYGTSDTPSDLGKNVDYYGEVYAESEENVGYVEDLENFAAVDLYGKHVTVYPTREHEQLENILDDEGIMSNIGDLPAYEKDPYTKDKDHPL
ncbi:yteA family sporulation protein [Thermaerobacillus caldiproteolyticus]|uniref:YteA family regulatory protein n=1 Tax=Thermaerobacillus caldiproteolyticus TaxID=247480 RepID=A0A7V9Z4J1_9BACL|nr:yteA family sporulation protein [Anoxybacillus caldiproteolyticus]MBA2873927.1 YteA family regulatory protein [Anoxybacillus caldiproteolyticus]QPA30472.1 yteA family sporulation protein [Anoxybacillus caldiproteolyticus]